MSSLTDRSAIERPLILAAVELSPEARQRLRSAGEVLELGSGGLKQADSVALRRASAILVNSKSQVSQGILEQAPRLRIVSTQSIGFDHIDIQAAEAAGIEVSHAPNRRDALAAIVMTHMLMLSRNIYQAVTQVPTGQWSQGITGSDLDGTTLFLVGFGGTARAVARKALAFDMNVIAFDVRPPTDVPEGVRIVESMQSGLTEADWVSLHVDLNPKTRHLISAQELDMMKPSAFLLNSSRGPVVDQAALVEALRTGSIAGAGLDVLEHEPPDLDDPILHVPNVLITPHIGFATRDVQRDMQACAIDTLVARLKGEKSEYVLPSTRRSA